jgi:cation transport ATPase
MKISSLTLLTLLIAATSFGQSKVATINVKASIYCDHCHQCESCWSRMENAVYMEKGIKRVDLDEETKTLKVVYLPSKTSPEKIRKAISRVGFDADDVKADAKAYEKLDPCCKKQ